jgi:SAM-dependent methyltransferase
MDTKFSKNQGTEVELYQRLNGWYQESVGISIVAKLRHEVAAILSKPPIYSVLQLGIPAVGDLTQGQKIPACSQANLQVCLGEQNLPYYANSQDSLLLIHGLDICHHPHHLLREMDRVLTDSGYLFIVGFNRRSLWGLLRFFMRWRDQPLWRCRFYSSSQLRDEKSIDYLPPINRDSWFCRYQLINRIGAIMLPGAGNVYIIAAKKRSIPLIPLRSRWRDSNLLPVNLKPSPETQIVTRQMQ